MSKNGSRGAGAGRERRIRGWTWSDDSGGGGAAEPFGVACYDLDDAALRKAAQALADEIGRRDWVSFAIREKAAALRNALAERLDPDTLADVKIS